MMHTLHQSTGSRSCAATAAIAAALCLVGPAWAQDSTEPTQLKPTVVTGTYLESADAAGTLTVTPVELTAPINQGFSTVADVLRTKLPQYGGPGNINPSFGNGGDGNSYISLRGLPGNATLVLVNGRRTSLAALNLIPDAAGRNSNSWMRRGGLRSRMRCKPLQAPLPGPHDPPPRRPPHLLNVQGQLVRGRTNRPLAFAHTASDRRYRTAAGRFARDLWHGQSRHNSQ